jgi:hypothetical protein
METMICGAELGECKDVIAELYAKVTEYEDAIAARDSRLKEFAAANARLRVDLAAACETRDRYQANGKRLLVETKELRARCAAMESIFRFPGVRKALLKVAHPDTGSGGNLVSRTEIFKSLMGVFERIETGKPIRASW